MLFSSFFRRGVFVFFCFLSGISVAETLSLDVYLKQVQLGNQAVRSSMMSVEASVLRAKEAGFLYSPTFFADFQAISDSKKPQNPTFQGSKTDYMMGASGVGIQTEFGLQASLSYQLSYISVMGANSVFIPESKYVEARPLVSLNYPLLRNAGGKETRAAFDLIEAQSLVKFHSESYRVKQLLADAETAYWRLILANEMVDIQTRILQKSYQIRDWSANRVKLQLADRSDLLQVNAIVQLRELDLQSAKDELSAASRAFNVARGEEAETVSEDLVSLGSIALSMLEIPNRALFREDVLVAKQLYRLASLNAKLSDAVHAPSLDLVASFALNRRDNNGIDAVLSSFSLSYPTDMVGVKYKMYLDGTRLSDVHQGILKEVESAALSFDRKVFEQDREWKDLTQKFKDTKKRLVISQKMEEIQKEKWSYELDRHRQGRTTTYQVILFEQDYTTAYSSRIRIEADLLRLFTQLKMFGN
ncbi:MAG: TolC family protein [Candidatus Margulisbacteria bacterium]|nr:TolC family protein [Candidatus Margulisiibacteriota bacterium]